MNILPLVLSALFIFACASTAFFRQRQATYWEQRSYLGYMSAERKARRTLASTAYQKAKKKKGLQEKTTKAITTKKKQGPYTAQHERTQLTEFSKLNIASLLKGHEEALYEVTARLLRLLYQDHAFFKEARGEKIEYRILDGLLQKAQATPEACNLADLFPEDNALKQTFYKMLKGTHNAYPPLGEYLEFDPSNGAKPVRFFFASIPLLQALFGQEGAAKIIQEEKNRVDGGKQTRISSSELQELLHNLQQTPFAYLKIERLLDFSAKKPPKEKVKGIDKHTQVTVTKNL